MSVCAFSFRLAVRRAMSNCRQSPFAPIRTPSARPDRSLLRNFPGCGAATSPRVAASSQRGDSQNAPRAVRTALAPPLVNRCPRGLHCRQALARLPARLRATRARPLSLTIVTPSMGASALSAISVASHDLALPPGSERPRPARGRQAPRQRRDDTNQLAGLPAFRRPGRFLRAPGRKASTILSSAGPGRRSSHAFLRSGRPTAQDSGSRPRNWRRGNFRITRASIASPPAGVERPRHDQDPQGPRSAACASAPARANRIPGVRPLNSSKINAPTPPQFGVGQDAPVKQAVRE